MKWFLVATALALVVAFTLWQRNSIKTTYINGLPSYSDLPGREFIFEHDCYIFKLNDRNTSWPLVGAHLTVPALPPEVGEQNIGAHLPGVRILDVVRTGARFRIVSVRRDESRQGTHVTFEVLLNDEAQRKYPRLDAFYLLDRATGHDAIPAVRETYAVERVKG